jgi:transcriptional regulator with XRE-family HTH domain
MKNKELEKKYTGAELAESFVFRTNLTTRQREAARKELAEARQKNKARLTDKQALYAKVLQLRFQIEDYSNSEVYDEQMSFSYFLRQYIKLNYKVNKQFAEDMNLDETELSQLLNKHRAPSEKIIIRLEIHSNNTIPALSWYKLLEKEKEHTLQTDLLIRSQETKFVKRRLAI